MTTPGARARYASPEDTALRTGLRGTLSGSQRVRAFFPSPSSSIAPSSLVRAVARQRGAQRDQGESLDNLALALGLVVVAALAASVGAGRIARASAAPAGSS